MARESKAAKRARARAVLEALEAAYPQSTCALNHETPFQLLIATMLSAQTTDLAVNKATARLFALWPTPEALSVASVRDVEQVINGIGLWRNKAKNAVATAQALVEHHDGQLPTTVAELVQLPGVGRKTATAVLGTAFGLAAGITVDTHMLRIIAYLRLSTKTTPEAMAAELEDLVEPTAWNELTHRIIDHGRLVCVARRPRCGVCPLSPLCPSHTKASVGYKPSNDETVPASAKGLSWLSRHV